MTTKTTKKKENDLWALYWKNRDEASKNALVEHYFSFVQRISVKVAESVSWNAQPDELASFGVDGLYRAIDAYDVSKNVKFELYASRRIHGSMIDGLRREDYVPRSVRIASDKFEKHKQRIQSHLGHKISDTEFVDLIGMDEFSFHRDQRKYIATSPGSIDFHVGDNSEDIKNDSNENLKDDFVSTPDAKVCRIEFFNKLLGRDFSKVERRVIYLYYYKGMTMDQVAKIIGLSESRISQMHKKVLQRLKKRIDKNPEYFDIKVIAFLQDCNDNELL
jgi:RNA polymerase sigma factor FliA